MLYLVFAEMRFDIVKNGVNPLIRRMRWFRISYLRTQRAYLKFQRRFGGHRFAIGFCRFATDRSDDRRR